MPFKMLTNDKLSANVSHLIEKVRKKHKDSGTELTGNRKAQVDLLETVLHKLKYLAKDPCVQLAEIVNSIKTITNEIKVLEAVKELSDEQNVLLAKLHEERESFRIIRDVKVAAFKADNVSNYSKEQWAKFVSNEQRALVITGAVLTVKSQIDDEYLKGALNKFLSFVTKNDPTNSVLYVGIDPAIGVTADNPMDEATKKQALAAYNQFISFVEEIKHYDRSKMKKVKTVEKDHLYIYDVSSKLAEHDHAELALATAEEKERYRRFAESKNAYDTFLAQVKPEIEGFNTSKLHHVETSVKNGEMHHVTGEQAKLPNGQKAKNNNIRDNEDITHYMDGKQKEAYPQQSRFFSGGVKAQLEAQHKLKHVSPEVKPADPNKISYQKRF